MKKHCCINRKSIENTAIACQNHTIHSFKSYKTIQANGEKNRISKSIQNYCTNYSLQLFTPHYLRSRRVSWKSKIKSFWIIQEPLASAYMLCLHESYWLYISDQGLRTQRVENCWKVARCAIVNIGKDMLVLVDFQNDYHSVNYWIIYQLVYLKQLSLFIIYKKSKILFQLPIHSFGLPIQNQLQKDQQPLKYYGLLE